MHPSGGGGASPVIDEAGFRAFAFRRLLPVHLFLSVAGILGFARAAPAETLSMSPHTHALVTAGLALLAGLRVAMHFLISPALTQRVGSPLVACVVGGLFVALGSVPAGTMPAGSVPAGSAELHARLAAVLPATIDQRCVLSATIALSCATIHAFALPLAWRAVLVLASALFVAPRWPTALEATDRISVVRPLCA